MLKKTLLAILVALAPALAWAQSGQFTPGHAIRATTPQGVPFSDAGGAAGSNKPGSGYLTELGITATGAPFCINDALTNAAGGYHRLCLGANSLGGGLISYDALAGASALPLQIELNGTLFPFPGTGGGNVLGPVSSTIGNIPTFANTGGSLISDPGTPISAVPKGRIVGYSPIGYTYNSGPFTFIAPPGVTINTAGSTTAGLQEAFTAGAAAGLAYDIYGSGTAGDDGAFAIRGTSGIGLAFPILRNKYFKMHAAQILGMGGGTSLVKIDSMIEGEIDLSGSQIGMNTTFITGTYSGATVLMQPTTVLPEGFTGIVSSHLKLGNLSRESVGQATLQGTMTNGSIQGSVLEALEVNGAGSGSTPLASSCVQFDSPQAGTGLLYNYIHISDIHLCSSHGFLEGTNATNAGNLRANEIHLDRVHPALTGTTTIGVDTFGSRDRWYVNVDNDDQTANLSKCMVLEATAKYNEVHINCDDINGAGNAIGVLLGAGTDYNTIDLNYTGTLTTPILDQSGGHNSYKVNGQILQEWKNGQQFNYLAPTSVTSGTGSSIFSGSGNSFGSVNTGTAAPTTVAVTFSMTFVNNVNCRASINQGGLWMVPTSAPSKTAVTFTSKNSAGSTTAMPDSSIVSWECWGQGN